MRSIEHSFEPRFAPQRFPAQRVPAHRVAGRRLSAGRLAATPAASPARLTRRGRLVVVLTVLALLVLAGFTLGRVSSQAAGPSRPLPTVTVAPGETIWQIAARVAPHSDRRAVVAQIEALNGLRGGRVVAGQQLRLPR
jgi:Tfp pilus assembly protein FimV